MAFRFASIERIPEPPSIHASKGSFVHRVLEVLFTRAAAGRTPEAAREAFDVARAEYEVHPDVTLLGLDEAAHEAFFTDGWSLVEGYLRMEDPTTVRDIGLELRLEAPVGDLSVRGTVSRSTPTTDWSSPTTRPVALPARSTSSRRWAACTSTRSCARPCWASGRPPCG
jgi:putative RecB family exonuclease